VKSATLRAMLENHRREGELYRREARGWVHCVACGHRCRIPPGRDGVCKVRSNVDGTLMVPFGYTAGMALDPIEKKPFFHVLPGQSTLSFGMLGCDYHCGYCQNWITSQALRDPGAVAGIETTSPDAIVAAARERGVPIITSTYNEPLITSEWAGAVFRAAQPHGLLCSYVSNGNGTPEVIQYLRPLLDMVKVDLKSFRASRCRQLGGRLDAVLETIATLHRLGIWVEVVTLVVPGFNDSQEELTDIARFLVSVSRAIPWHVTAFHQEYRMTETDPTPARALLRAAETGEREGLLFVYAGNLPGRVGSWQDTRCPGCQKTLISRTGFRVVSNILDEGACPSCRTPIPGIWSV
jgi:pyruvate formate lyase activating enzyme